MDCLQRHRQAANPLMLMAVLVFLLLAGCATTQVDESQEIVAAESSIDGREDQDEQNEDDPYEGFNRAMYTFNDTLDSYLAEPIATGYKWITPELLQTGVANVFSNMKEITVLLNDMLQGKFLQGAEDTGRFLLNTTVGLGGIFDVATELGLEKHNEDFGQTLAVWGVPTGPYLVLPILGPATFRGVPGTAFDTLANPVTYLGWPVAVMAAVDKRANADGALKFIDEAAVDPYVFTRESYLQWREHLATDGQQDLSDYFFEDEEDLMLEDEDDDVMMPSDDVEYKVVAEISAENSETVSESDKQMADSSAVVPDTQSKALPLETSEEMKAYEKAAKAFEKATQEFDEAEKDLENLRNRGSKYMLEQQKGKVAQ